MILQLQLSNNQYQPSPLLTSNLGMCNQFYQLQSPPHVFVNRINYQQLSTIGCQVSSNKTSLDNCIHINYYCVSPAAWVKACKSKGCVTSMIVCNIKKRGISFCYFFLLFLPFPSLFRDAFCNLL